MDYFNAVELTNEMAELKLKMFLLSKTDPNLTPKIEILGNWIDEIMTEAQ